MSEYIADDHRRLKEFRQSVRPLFESAAWPEQSEEEWRRSDISVFDIDALGVADSEVIMNTRAERKSEGLFSLNEALHAGTGLGQEAIERTFRHLEGLRDKPANRFVLWNLINAEDIFVLHIPAGEKHADSDEVYELCWHSLGDDVARQAALVVLADDMSSARVLLRFKGMEGHLQSFMALYDVGDEADLNVTVLQESSEEVFALYQAQSVLGKDAQFTHFEGIVGAGFVKNRVDVALAGSGSNLNLNGIYLARGDQHVDMRTVQHHVADHADSRTFYKGAVRDEAETIFQGLIEVNNEARGTDAYLTNNNLLLSDEAKADSIPSLNIRTNDVKCSHGSTTGKIDEEHIYYLQCRGLSHKEAEEFLILGFFEELISDLPERAKDRFRKKIQERVTDR